MSKLLTTKTLGITLLLLAVGAGLWYALAEAPRQTKLDTTYSFT
ncbi:hypothetical protein [Fibrella aquatilis]|nr:hypothetical protein [Fibrella aquatilis]